MLDKDEADYYKKSPSPRRAWIEITLFCPISVPRKSRPPLGGRGLKYFGVATNKSYAVALPSEGVD